MQAQLLETSDTQSLMAEIGRAARRGARAAALAPSAVKDAALRAAAREIRLASARSLPPTRWMSKRRALPARRPPRSTG